jgi:hypothetical protein
MAERERAGPWNREAGPAKSEELMPWQQFQRPVAFDSTFIEVTADIEDILENLRDRFGGTISRGQGRRLSQDPIALGPRTRPQQQNAASPKGSGVLFDHEIVEEESLSLAGLAATYSPRA